jgi:DNA-binding NarL/FixJ family response regulator
LDDPTEREHEVLSVMAEGARTRPSCPRLFLSPKTVETYARSPFTKPGPDIGPNDNRRVLAVLAFLRS